MGIIGSQQIWATHHQCLNDTQEFLHAKEIFRRELAGQADANPLSAAMWHTLDGEGFEGVPLYVASLSEEPDSLAQWRAYGGPASGFSLGFETNGIVLPSRFRLVPCIYDKENQREKVRSLVDDIRGRAPGYTTGNPEPLRLYVSVSSRIALHTLALVFKHPKFAAEKEWRIISEAMMDSPPGAPLDFREGRSMLIPYRRVPLRNSRNCFPLTHVVVGPNPNPEQSVRSVRSLLASHRLTHCNPRMSEVPYRSW